jgi:hypothetical protein
MECALFNNAVLNADAIWKSKFKCNERSIRGLLWEHLCFPLGNMSFGKRILQPVLECGISGDAKARFLFLEQPIVLSCQEVSATLSILFGRHSSSCKVIQERPSLCWRSVINHFQTCKARYLCSAISYGVT